MTDDGESDAMSTEIRHSAASHFEIFKAVTETVTKVTLQS